MQKPNPKIRHDGALTISVGGSRKETQWKPRELTWGELVQRLRTPARTRETVQEYQAMTKPKQGEVKDVGGFVGGTLKGGRRKADAVAWRHLLTLDLDYVTGDVWAQIELLSDYGAVLYSTHSHTPDKPRYRLVIPLKRPVTPDEYAAAARRVAADLGIEMFDDTTYEPHRLMYWPSTSLDGDYIFEVQDGLWLDPDEILARYEDWKDPSQWPRAERVKGDLKRLAEKQGNPLEKPGLLGAFCRAYTITDAIETFLSDVYEPCGPGRFTYREGSTTGGLVLYDGDSFAYSHHGTDPVSGKLCNAFDLVRVHKFGLQDEDTVPDTPANRVPSYKAMMDFIAKDPPTKTESARSKAAEASADFADENVDWFNLLSVDRHGAIESTIDNVIVVLENDTALKGKYAYDELWERPVVLENMPWQTARTTKFWNDEDDAGLRYHLEKYYQISAVGKTLDAVSVVMARHRFHPVRDYLNSLPVWDGVPRVDTLLIDWLGAEDCAYTRAVTRKALVGAIARVFMPGCKHDHMLVLVGPQGTGKSTILHILGGEWFSDSLTTVSGKEAYEALQGAWIIEMGELAATKRAEIETIKLFVSKQEDTYRAAYGHRTQVHPRQCAFFGTTNDGEFLHDLTGGRRFWPVTVDQQERKYEDLWHQLTTEIRDQVWAEAMVFYGAGERLYLDRDTEAEARKRQEKHTEGNLKLGLVEDYLETLLPENWESMDLQERRAFLSGNDFGSVQVGTVRRDKVCALEIWAECFNEDPTKIPIVASREIRNILLKIKGWEPYKGSADGVLRFRIYGKQRAFYRPQ